MSRPRALVAEDEAPQRQRLCDLLGELWPELTVVAQCEDGLSALEALTALQPEIAFLDIRMPGLTGVEVARAAGARTHVVFTTAYDEYAVGAFEHAAVDYLLKPIGRERLAQSIARLQERIAAAAPLDLGTLLDTLSETLQRRAIPAGAAGGVPVRDPAATPAATAAAGDCTARNLPRLFGVSTGLRWITGSAGNVTRMFGIDEVLFFQAQDKYVRVVTAEDEVQIRTSLRELLAMLDPETFWQIHRGVIVRAGAIHRIEAGDDGRLRLRVKGRDDVLPVSHAFQYRFKPM